MTSNRHLAATCGSPHSGSFSEPGTIQFTVRTVNGVGGSPAPGLGKPPRVK